MPGIHDAFAAPARRRISLSDQRGGYYRIIAEVSRANPRRLGVHYFACRHPSFASSQYRPVIGPGASVALAPLVHAGVAPLSSVWLIACALAWVPCKILTSRWLRESIGLIALTVGLSLAAAVIANGDPIGVYIAGLGVETSAIAQGGPIKIGYWGALGVVMLVLGRQVSVCEGKLALAFSILLGVGLIPLSYGLCLGLVMANFRIPAVTSIAIRVLITGLDLALVMICLRGRANMLTAGAMLFMLADELRLLATA